MKGARKIQVVIGVVLCVRRSISAAMFLCMIPMPSNALIVMSRMSLATFFCVHSKDFPSWLT